MTDNHWAITLYQRYVELYGDEIEQPITPTQKSDVVPQPPG